MDINAHTENENIRKIEDIIDIQKANGNFGVRQVAFNLPSESEGTVSAKSLESGLSKTSKNASKKKKVRTKRRTSPLPDVISWPSDSDITVLRMKLCLNNSDLADKVGNIPGDGLHQPDSSSMFNLATLMRQSQPASKHSLNIEEYLMPLTSWEDQEEKETKVEEKTSDEDSSGFHRDFQVYEAVCSRHNKAVNESDVDFKDSDAVSVTTKKSKMARFLRLYFCPCCTCLYKIEKMKDVPSIYLTKRKN